MNKLAEKVKSLFTEDLVKLVIGFEKGSHGVRPFFCRNIEEADKLVWDDFCTNNIAVYLTKTELSVQIKQPCLLISLHCVLFCN